jgi:hypothetical protein
MATGHQGEERQEAWRKPLLETRFWRAYHSHRYAILFYTLLFTLVAMPITFFFGWSATAIEVLLGVTLLAAVMPMGKPKTRLFILAAILILLAARPIAAEINEQELSDATLGLWAVIGLFAAAGAVRFVVKAEEIYSEHVYAALGAYLMAGMFFGTTYWVIEAELPGSFGGPSEFTRQAAVYFSFVTLATLGYGDFLPKTDMARGLVVFEVMGGQLFLAVMIARLVGLYGGGKNSS